MSDYEVCANLCDDRGFTRQAALLRAIGQEGLRIFTVCERLQSEDRFLDDHGGVPRALFFDREDAEREARRRDVLALRERNLYGYCEGEISYFTGLTRWEFERQVSLILGTDYTLPDPGTHNGPLFPAGATDEQILAVSRLFEAQFFYVAELELIDRANP
jgi:hypothetical protein